MAGESMPAKGQAHVWGQLGCGEDLYVRPAVCGMDRSATSLAVTDWLFQDVPTLTRVSQWFWHSTRSVLSKTREILIRNKDVLFQTG